MKSASIAFLNILASLDASVQSRGTSTGCHECSVTGLLLYGLTLVILWKHIQSDLAMVGDKNLHSYSSYQQCMLRYLLIDIEVLTHCRV